MASSSSTIGDGDSEIIKGAGVEDVDAMSEEQRIAWLRERGVTIELPEDSAKNKNKITQQQQSASAAATASDKIPFRVTYVHIPVDSKEPITQHTVECTLPKEPPRPDPMCELLKPHFARGSGSAAVDSAALAAHTRGTAAAGVSVEAVEALTAQRGITVEAYPLLRPDPNLSPGPSRGTGTGVPEGFGVTAYIDELGVLKQLPKNDRASAIVERCGQSGVPLHGEVFLGVTCGPALSSPAGVPVASLDFTTGDMDSSSPWFERAKRQGYERAEQSEEWAKKMNDVGMGNNMGIDVKEQHEEQEEDNFRWSQSDEDVEVVVAVPESVMQLKSNNVRVIFKTQGVEVYLKGIPEASPDPVVRVEPLYRAIRPEESTWTIGKHPVTKRPAIFLTMEKVQEELKWYSVKASDKKAPIMATRGLASAMRPGLGD